MKSRLLHALAAAMLCGLVNVTHAANAVTQEVSGLRNPESVCIGPEGRSCGLCSINISPKAGRSRRRFTTDAVIKFVRVTCSLTSHSETRS